MPPRHAPPARWPVASGASVEQGTSGRARGPDVFCSTDTDTDTDADTAAEVAPVPPGQWNSCGNAAAT